MVWKSEKKKNKKLREKKEREKEMEKARSGRFNVQGESLPAGMCHG